MVGGLRALAAARLVGARDVYVWADARPEHDAATGRVHPGADRRDARGQEGRGWLPGGHAGSAQSWRELLVDLKARRGHRARTGHRRRGARLLEAIEEVSPTTRHQRCTVHKTTNVLDKLPKSVQPAAKADLREIGTAPDRAKAETAITTFAEKYGAKYEKAATCLVKDRDVLLTFYDFPAEHWDHLRTANPIESVFATVRHRTVRTKGALSQDTARLMVFKLVMAAAKTWRRLKGETQLPKVVQGVKFRNGVEVTNTPAQKRRLITASPRFQHSSGVKPQIRNPPYSFSNRHTSNCKQVSPAPQGFSYSGASASHPCHRPEQS